MSKVAIHSILPPLTFSLSDGRQMTNDDLLGKNWVIYFYPKDNTPGCTLEGRDFAAQYPQFEKLNTGIIGVSRDSAQSHEKFSCKLGLPFPLASDADGQLCKIFDVVWPQNMFGKLVNMINRSTFLIDAHGVLRQEWRSVNVKGHVEEVLDAVKKLR